MESSLSKFLRNYKKHNNPFLDKNFFISAMETDLIASSYSINNVKIKWENNKCIICPNNDIILAAYLFLSIEDNIFGFDKDAELFIGDKKIFLNKNASIVEKFNYIEPFLPNDNFIIKYSNSEFGRNAYEYNISLIWFKITEDQDDDYYFNKTVNLLRQDKKDK